MLIISLVSSKMDWMKQEIQQVYITVAALPNELGKLDQTDDNLWTGKQT